MSKWLVTVAVMTGTFMAVMDVTVVNVALPHMMGSFAQGKSAITWVATSYSIAEIIMATMAGWLSTLIGRKRLYLVSHVVFIFGSVLCGTAHSFETMLLYRTLQGIGGGALIPVSQAVLRESFPEEEQGMAMAVYGMGVVLAPGLGAIIGGYLIEFMGWPWIFYINVPVGLAGIVMVAMFIHDPHYLRRGVRRIDWLGIVLLTVGLTGMQLVLERGQEKNWFDSKLIIVGTIVTLSALIFFVFWELHNEHPIVNIRIMKNMPLSVGALLGGLFGVGLFGSTYILPQVTQELMGYPALESGLVLLPRAIALLCVMPIAGALYSRVSPRWLVAGGLGLVVLSFVSLSNLTLAYGVWDFVPPLLLMGAGMPFVFVTLSTVSLSTIQRESMTEATSIITLSRRVGGNIGYAWSATILARREQFHHAVLSEHVSESNPVYQAYRHQAESLFHAAGYVGNQATVMTHALVSRVTDIQSLILSYQDVARVFAVMFVFALPLILLMPGRRKAVS